eukprot:m.292966 g.292966  ORF g.292966 m.292966 type:complete len:347 (+) comp55119_c0_seq3:217-1257(+)
MDTPHLTDLFSAQSPLPSLDDDLWHREEEEEPGFAQPPPSAPEPSAEPVSPLPLLDDSWTLLDEELGFVPPLPFAPEPSAGLVSPPVAMSSPACSLSAGSSTSDFGPQKRSHSPDLNDEDEEDDDDDEAERAGEADEPSFSSKRPKGADGKQSKRTAQYRTSKRGTRGDTPMVATFVACFLVTDALRKGSRLPASLPAEAFADTAAIWNSRGGRMPSKKNAKAPPKPLKRQIEQHLQALAIHLGFAPPLSSAELNRCRLTKSVNFLPPFLAAARLTLFFVAGRSWNTSRGGALRFLLDWLGLQQWSRASTASSLNIFRNRPPSKKRRRFSSPWTIRLRSSARFFEG